MFITFITAVRQCYEPVVSEFCIKSLLNVFKYEILLIENFLVTEIKEVFTTELFSTDDREVQLKIEALIDSDSDSDWKRLNLLERKIADLDQINFCQTEEKISA